MKKMFSIISFCLFFASFQSIASRPAEDEAAVHTEQQVVDNTPIIPSSEVDIEQNKTVMKPQLTEKSTIETTPLADVIDIEQTQDKSQIIIIDFPLRGMDMSKVLNELGEPIQRSPAIGKPPITRWVYPDRTVFFEYSHVIHVVAK